MNECILIDFEGIDTEQGIDPVQLAEIATCLDKMLGRFARLLEVEALLPLQIFAVERKCLRVALANAKRKAVEDPLDAAQKATATLGLLCSAIAFVLHQLGFVALEQSDAGARHSAEAEAAGKRYVGADDIQNDAAALHRALIRVDGGEVIIRFPEAPSLVVQGHALSRGDFLASMPRRPVDFSGASQRAFAAEISFLGQETTVLLDGQRLPMALALSDHPRPPQLSPMATHKHHLAVIWKSTEQIPRKNERAMVKGVLYKSLNVEVDEPLSMDFARADGILVVDGMQIFR